MFEHFTQDVHEEFMNQDAADLTTLKFTGLTVTDAHLFNGGPLPRLRDLTFIACYIHIRCPVFSASLTHLTLDDCTFRHPLKEFLSILGLLQILESLSLHFVTFEGVPNLEADNPTVDLPQLKKVALTSTDKILLTIGQCLSLPPDASIKLGCVHSNASLTIHEVIQSLSSILSRHIRTVSSQSMNEMWKVDVNWGSGASLGASQSLAVIFSPMSSVAAKAVVALHWTSNIATAPTFPQVLAMVPLVHRAFKLNLIFMDHSTPSVDDWISLRDVTPLVDRITATSKAICSLLEALRKPPLSPAAFPHLKWACVADLDFTAVKNASLFEGLLESLEFLAENSVRKDLVVVLVGCMFAPKMMEQIEEYVVEGRVYLDGRRSTAINPDYYAMWGLSG